jgi:hypothetical protein
MDRRPSSPPTAPDPLPPQIPESGNEPTPIIPDDLAGARCVAATYLKPMPPEPNSPSPYSREGFIEGIDQKYWEENPFPDLAGPAAVTG